MEDRKWGLLSQIQSVFVLCEFHKIIHSSFSNALLYAHLLTIIFCHSETIISVSFLPQHLTLHYYIRRETHIKDHPHPLPRKPISLLIKNAHYHPECDQQQASREVYQAAEISSTSLPYAKRLSGR
jgi:hypothetical protein